MGDFHPLRSRARRLLHALQVNGISVTHEGIMGIDATWKTGYPNPCIMPDEVLKKVDARWREYGFR